MKNKETPLVVRPVVRWLKKQDADWEIRTPKHSSSETGWDIEARRKNMDLLIEAKYIDGPFLSSFEGLVTAPLANRPQHSMKTKYRSWCQNVCWAIGSSRDMVGIHTALLDDLSRTLSFWKHYSEDLNLKYVFFVEDKKVARASFRKLLKTAKAYKKAAAKKSHRVRRSIASKLLKKLEYK